MVDFKSCTSWLTFSGSAVSLKVMTLLAVLHQVTFPVKAHFVCVVADQNVSAAARITGENPRTSYYINPLTLTILKRSQQIRNA
jgi:hypothetical protein